MHETMGQIIKRLRKERGLTQESLAERLGVTFQAVSKWETDAGMPDVSQIVPLANAFGVRTDVLFGLEGRDEGGEVQEIIRSAYRLIDGPNDRDGLLRCYQALLEGLKRYPCQPALLLQALEAGGLNLDQSMRQWEIGEALAKRAQSLLGEVRAKLDAAQAEQATAANTAGTQDNLA